MSAMKAQHMIIYCDTLIIIPLQKVLTEKAFCFCNSTVKENNCMCIYTLYLLMKPNPEILVSYLRIRAGSQDKLFGFFGFSITSGVV